MMMVGDAYPTYISGQQTNGGSPCAMYMCTTSRVFSLRRFELVESNEQRGN